jgi:hypothetical protein
MRSYPTGVPFGRWSFSPLLLPSRRWPRRPYRSSPADEIRERAPYLEETRLSIGEPTWKTLDRETVEMSVGQEV